MVFNKEERQFLKDLVNCDSEKEYSQVQDKYGQDKFNVLKHRVRERAREMRNQVRKDLELYKKVEDILNLYL